MERNEILIQKFQRQLIQIHLFFDEHRYLAYMISVHARMPDLQGGQKKVIGTPGTGDLAVSHYVVSTYYARNVAGDPICWAITPALIYSLSGILEGKDWRASVSFWSALYLGKFLVQFFHETFRINKDGQTKHLAEGYRAVSSRGQNQNPGLHWVFPMDLIPLNFQELDRYHSD